MNARGFTIIELLVVMAILGVLAAAAMPLGEALLTAQRERDLRQSLREVRSALDRYKDAADKGLIERVTDSGYPPSLDALIEGTRSRQAGHEGEPVHFMRRLPRDPFAGADSPPAATWRVRSYASPPDNPAPGADVFDIYSSSDSNALDGSPYRSW